MSRVDALFAIAEAHPEMPLRDALTATVGQCDALDVRHVLVDSGLWGTYAATALQGLVGVGQTPQHVAEQCARYADAMFEVHQSRWGNGHG